LGNAKSLTLEKILIEKVEVFVSPLVALTKNEVEVNILWIKLLNMIKTKKFSFKNGKEGIPS